MLYLLGTLYHFLFVVSQLPVPLKMHLSLGIVMWFCHKISYMHIVIIDFALSNSFWYVTFQGYSVLSEVSYLSDSQMSAVLGENLLK